MELAVIRFGAVLSIVVVAIGLLVGGILTSSLLLVYLSIGVAALAGVLLVAGVLIWRENFFGASPATAPAAIPEPAEAALVGAPADLEMAGPASLPADGPAVPGAVRLLPDAPDTEADAEPAPSVPPPDQPASRSEPPVPEPAAGESAAAPESAAALQPAAESQPVAESQPPGPEPAPPAGPGPQAAGKAPEPERPDATAAAPAAAAAEAQPATAEPAEARPAAEPTAPEPAAPEPAAVEAELVAVDAEPAGDEPAGDEPATAEAERAAAAAEPAARPDVAGQEGGSPDAQAGGPSGAGQPATDSDQVTVVPGIARFHRSECILIRFMGPEDLEVMSRTAAVDSGLVPCKACKPDAPQT
ncbi:MAG: hypothetical protein ACLP52_24455 [Streptosporangiaceae bacterium]